MPAARVSPRQRDHDKRRVSSINALGYQCNRMAKVPPAHRTTAMRISTTPGNRAAPRRARVQRLGRSAGLQAGLEAAFFVTCEEVDIAHVAQHDPSPVCRAGRVLWSPVSHKSRSGIQHHHEAPSHSALGDRQKESRRISTAVTLRPLRDSAPRARRPLVSEVRSR